MMLSRLTARAVASSWARPMPRALSTTTAVQAETSSERDLVNFPRRTRPIDPAPVRHHWIPEEYFTFFHNKTGVTGPYVFAATFTTYLCSKEIWVLEHEFYSGIAFAVVMGGVIKMASPGVTKWLDEEVDKHDGKLKKIRQDEIDKCKSAIGAENDAQWMATSYEELINAKKDNVGLQLEAAYRSRLQQAYTQVKKRLDYQLELTNVMRRTEQKHLVDWIIGNVRKSITAKQEDDALKKCVADLKSLA